MNRAYEEELLRAEMGVRYPGFRPRKIRNEERWNGILIYVRAVNAERGRGPSIRELSRELGISSLSTVEGYVERMLRAGWLYRTEDKHGWLYAGRPAVDRVTGGVRND